MYGPILIALALVPTALIGLPIPLAAQRERKFLRRLWLLAAQLAVNLVLALMAPSRSLGADPFGTGVGDRGLLQLGTVRSLACSRV